MGILLGQLPPTEVARLKAELAETLISNFCYPRFFDYRTSSLRMRPIDRTKRQEVWLFLSSVDFTSWNRVDLMSPDFQRQIERLFIHFVQRNRSFFGEQGRKRMSDVRMLIGICASAVAEGLRNHLKGQGNSPYGSPRPVVSWLTTNVTGRPEPNWEQLASRTMLIQQQLQEVRGEIKASAANNTTTLDEARPATSRRSSRSRSNGNGTSSIEREVPVPPTPNLAENKAVSQAQRAETSSPTPLITTPAPTGPIPPIVTPAPTGPTPPIATPAPTSPASPFTGSVHAAAPVPTNSVVAPPPAPAARKVEPGAPLANVPTQSGSSVPSTPTKTADKSPETVVPSSRVAERAQPIISAEPKVNSNSGGEEVAFKAQPPATTSSAQAQTRSLFHAPQAPVTAVAVGKTEDTTVLVSDEDVVIFEQMRHQLVVWLRIEAVRSGADISGQGPVQLLELLHQQDSIDDSRLQVVSTLLGLSDQVISNRRASLLEYKQAMMFYLMHTRRS